MLPAIDRRYQDTAATRPRRNVPRILHYGSTVTKTEGVWALWKGLTPFATHLTLKYALRMGSNAVLQTTFQNGETGEISNCGRVAAGFGAGVLEALLIVTPFEVLSYMGSGFKLEEDNGKAGCASKECRLVDRQKKMFRELEESENLMEPEDNQRMMSMLLGSRLCDIALVNTMYTLQKNSNK